MSSWLREDAQPTHALVPCCPTRVLLYALIPEESGPHLSNSRALVDLSDVYVVYSCLYEGVHVVEHPVIRGAEDKMGLKELVESSK